MFLKVKENYVVDAINPYGVREPHFIIEKLQIVMSISFVVITIGFLFILFRP